ncbi:MAG: hypothetical protein WBG86_02830 [Polyangiales bacterium]
MRLLSRNFCTGGLVWLVVASCSVYDPELIDATTAGVPPRPSAATSSEVDQETLVFALKDVFVEQSAENAATIGLDLDSMVTTGQEDASCRPREIEGETVGQSVVDGDKGIDNSLGSTLLPAAGAVLPCLQDNLALTMGIGAGTILLVVREWNGEQDDASVVATLTTSVDGTDEDPALVGFPADDDVALVYKDGNDDRVAPDPGWAGRDSWFVDPEDFEEDASGTPDIMRPKIVHEQAYVSFGRIVIPLRAGTGFRLVSGDGSLPSDGSMSVLVNGGFMTGDISEDRSRLDHGLFTGRMTLETLASATAQIGICALNATVIETLFGEYADVPADPELDGLDAECDAFSLGVTFSGVGGQIAGVAPRARPKVEPCANSEDVPPIDRCCPSEWLAGRPRAETCDTPAKAFKAAAFDRLPNSIELPVAAPNFL